MGGEELDGRLAVVTGGGRGIGAATSVALAAAGWDVCIVYVAAAAQAERVAGECRDRGRRAMTVRADVAVEEEIEGLFARLDDEFGPRALGALVNNAGIVAPQSRADALTAVRVRRLLEVNVLGTVLCAREAIRRMSPLHGGDGGVIVNVSSAASRLGSAGEYVDYAASKGAVDTFTVGLAREVARERIRVNAVRPGLISTEIHASGGRPGRAQQLGPTIPMGRPGEAEEVAAAVTWLCSTEASYVTGAILDIAGGR